jgi:hypothetical protein
MSADPSDIQVEWRKSSRSCDTGNCIDVALALSPQQVGVRDTKDVSGPILTYTARDWQAFVSAVRTGAFDASQS